VGIEIRIIEADEAEGWLRAAERTFGTVDSRPELVALELAVVEPERSIGAFDGDTLVGTTAAYSFSMTVPGAADLPTAGVTMVTVAPTHRRRGILTEMMRFQLDEIDDRNEPLAALNASEALIYDRFGYGPAVDAVTLRIDTRAAAFRDPIGPGEFELVEPADARAIVSDIYARSRTSRAGSMSRTDAWWDAMLSPLESWKGGGPLQLVVHRDASGRPDGYACYLMKGSLEHFIQHGTLEMRDLVGVDPDAEAALWRFCLDVDLTTQLVALGRPVDDPVRWRLVEPRQLRTLERFDLLWVRLVDVAGALACRGYAVDESMVVRVVDRFLERNDGCYRLTVGGDEVRCERTDEAPALTLDVSVLGATYLGGVSFAQLAAGGRLVEHEAGAVARADALFATPLAPHCATKF
jgi:predicted acetyltransferase